MPKPPKNKRELMARLAEIVQHGEYTMPAKRYRGSGAAGLYLEYLLGLTTGNRDIPDSLGWELKTYSSKTNYITLFHKEPHPEGIMREMVKKYGWKDDEGRLSFRHTIAGKTDRFKVVERAGQILVHPLKGKNRINPYWTNDDILSAAGGKLRRLALVFCARHKNRVSYSRVDCYQDLLVSQLIFEVLRGTIKIDFDAREARPGSDGLRNHGTKFRIAPDDICRLYARKERIN